MHDVLININNELKQIIISLNNLPSDDPFSVSRDNWSFPGLTKSELAEDVYDLYNIIDDLGADSLGSNGERIKDYERRLQFLRTRTIPNLWDNPQVAVPAFQITLNGLRSALRTALKPDKEVALELKRATARLRAMEARLNGLEPKTSSLEDLVARIEAAHEAADRLPIDLAALVEAQSVAEKSIKKIESLYEIAMKDKNHISETRVSADKIQESLVASSTEAAAIIKRSEEAYSAATSQGLAAAFAERSKTLNESVLLWSIGLVAALGLGSYFGSTQVSKLIEVLNDSTKQAGTLPINAILALLSVGAPIWFSWLATKQIGQRFRLSEDYAFKAAVSRAYEGYRREAARIDTDMEARLLSSALTRLDEQPLRLVESASYGSPWHELMASDAVKEAIKVIPGFTAQVSGFAKDALKVLRSGKAQSKSSDGSNVAKTEE